ncbi:response regulator [Paenibacillus sp. LHD-117]|uniref:response regulator n=1 Tax=Paenibacillus sp. LHD-117 TaxID=3071412 RepID=UPI0027E024FC|nr:response regulator [Paenibacillus sp. LHD-117]MDQ6423189.1 response regulator [Paenibacillus sp. LHD-117]
MNKMSLRTKGLIFIVLISLIPLLIAGVGNYSAVKKAMLRSEMDKIGSRLSSQADNIAAWMDIRKAEVLVMSRTDVVRYGSPSERKTYFQRELVRSGFAYHTIGFVGADGMAVRSDGPDRDMSGEPFFESAIDGKVTITDPYKPEFSLVDQSYIVVPVYGSGTSIVGVIYASIPFTSFNRFFDFAEETNPVRFYNDEGAIIYSSEASSQPPEFITEDPVLEAVSGAMLHQNEGRSNVEDTGQSFMVFYSKVDGTPWRIAMSEPVSKMEALLAPIFWRTVTTIAISELIIGIFFYLYFEKIVKRLERILSVTEQAAAGEFEAEHLDTSQFDEIGQLAHSVNGMMEHLQEMFDRLGAIINQNQYGFIVLDDQYRVTYLNQTAEEMLGYKTAELAGHATPIVFMDMDEIELEAARLSAELGREIRPGIEVFRELRTAQFSYEREWTFIHKDGTRIPTLHSSNGLRDRTGKFTGVVGMVRDISDRKHVENARNRLLNIVESAQDLIASVNMDGDIVYMNRAGKTMLGLPESGNVKAKAKAFIDPSMHDQLRVGTEQALKHGYWNGSLQMKKANGDPLFASFVVVVHEDEYTGEMFYSCIARDISEQKLVQEELVRTTLEAEEANKAKSSFLALMSHEIRTPLNGIIGLTSLLRKTELSVVQKDYIDKMHLSSESLLRIINDVLDFSKIEAGKVETERFPFKPEELLHRIANQLSVFLGGKEQFEFMIKTPDRLPQMLIGDSLRLEQVLLNLCMNAIKFTGKGLVKLDLDMEGESEGQVWIRFLIADTGIGLSREQVDRLFKPFTQADSSTTRKFGGTGLGLVIAQNLVKLMGGTLSATSVEGAGSRFYFTLPFGVDPARIDSADKLPPFSNEQTVWVLEDNKRMRDHWTLLLESFGLTTIAFGSWQTMFERLRIVGEGARPQLLLTDMEMPDMYGTETWLDMHAAAAQAGVPIIALTTTFGRDELLQLPYENRPAGILAKPVTRKALLRAFQDATGRKSLAKKDAGIGASMQTAKERRSQMKILLAEDNKINQMVALEMLKDAGYEAQLAENGEEALRMLEQGRWDLVLMDIHMPVMDGTEAVRIMRSKKEYDGIPVIAVTANVVKKDHERYLKLGMNEVITKPLSVERMQEALAYWLERKAGAEGGLADSDERDESRTRWHDRKPGNQGTPAAAMRPIAGMDVESALERVNGKLPILRHMIDQFKLDYERFMDQLRLALKQEETDKASRMLHTLKGAAGYLSAAELADAVGKVSDLVKERAESAELQLALSNLEKELATLLQGLRESGESFDRIV